MFKRQIPLAWLQLSRVPSRLLVAVAGIAFADFLMFMQLGFQAALYESNTLLHNSLKADLILMSPQAQNISSMGSFPRRRLTQAMNFLKEIESAEALYTGRANLKNPDNQREIEVLFFAFNPSRSLLKLPGVSEQLQTLKLTDTLDNLTISNLDLAFSKNEFVVTDNINYKMAMNFQEQRQLEYKLEKSKALPSLAANLNFGYNAFNDGFGFFEANQNWWINFCIGILIIAIAVRILK
jgi:DevC protein